MGKNILVISTSLRKHSNSEALAEAFIAGAESGGNRVERISLREKTLHFARAALRQKFSHDFSYIFSATNWDF